MEAAARAKTEKSAPKSVKCEGFAYSFFSIAGAWYIICSCHRVERQNKEYYLQVMQVMQVIARSNPPETPGFVEEQNLAFAP